MPGMDIVMDATAPITLSQAQSSLDAYLDALRMDFAHAAVEWKSWKVLHAP